MRQRGDGIKADECVLCGVYPATLQYARQGNITQRIRKSEFIRETCA